MKNSDKTTIELVSDEDGELVEVKFDHDLWHILLLENKRLKVTIDKKNLFKDGKDDINK